jgi:ABC-type transport system substrate-binding protein
MKRTGLRALTALLLSAALLAGCAGSKTQTPEASKPAASSQPKKLTIAAGTTAVSMDVHKVTDTPSLSVLEHINETLFRITETGEVKPLLADSITAGADNKTYTIKLHKGITFSDGTPFNAEAVKINFERILNKDTKAAFRSLLDPVEKIETPDELTVVLHTKYPFAPIQAHLSHPGTAIIAPSAIAKGDEAMANSTIGTGPYMLKEYKKDQAVTLVKNPKYWGTPANVDEVVFKAVKEDSARVIEAESGTADVVLRVPPTEMERIRNNPNLELSVVPGLRVIYVYFNNQKGPFTNPKLRQAVNYAIDKEAIVKNLLKSAGKPVDAPMAEPVFGYAKQTPYAYNPEKAKQLLAESGYDTSKPITLYHPTGRYSQDAKIAEAIAVQLKQIGLTVNLKTLEWAQYLAVLGKPLAENEVQMALLGWSPSTMDADYALYELFHSSRWPDNGGSNRGFYKNEQVDKLLEAGRATLDPNERKKYYAEAQKLIWEDAPWIFLHSETQLTAINKKVTGFKVHPSERTYWYAADKK